MVSILGRRMGGVISGFAGWGFETMGACEIGVYTAHTAAVLVLGLLTDIGSVGARFRGHIQYLCVGADRDH